MAESADLDIRAPTDRLDPSVGVSVVIASDHPSVGLGLRALFDVERRITVVGEARSGEEAIEAVRVRRPAVLLLDVRSPAADSIAALAVLGRATEVLVVSAVSEPDMVLRAIMAGARSYLVHGFFAQQALIAAVLDTAGGLSHLSPPAAAALVDACFERPSARATAQVGHELTRREREVLALMAEGLSNGQIADRLTISGKTVKNHVHHVYKRLQVEGRDQAVAMWSLLRVASTPHLLDQ
jgi:DNA-binding NarL/FixJ family response regulator